jgi:hypothetical protein
MIQWKQKTAGALVIAVNTAQKQEARLNEESFGKRLAKIRKTKGLIQSTR